MPVKKIAYYGTALLLIGVLLGMQIGSFASEGDAYASIKKIENAFFLIKKHYVEDVDSAQLSEAGVKGMLNTLDPHSVYISKERMERVSESFDASFEGIGISYEFIRGQGEQDTVTVLSALPGGPSEAAGLVSGDRIIAVDDSSAVGFTHEDVQRTLKGPQGTKVDVTVRRPGYDEPLHFTITRDEIPLNTVDAAYMVDDRTGYIKLNRFARTTYSEFMRAMRRLEREGMERLILDLQGNAGGFMNMAIRISDEFLSKDEVIVSARSRHEQFNQMNRAQAGGTFEEKPLVVLIDEHSASASEIVAGALQDHDRALIVGRRSFGKGLVQKQFELQDGSAMRVTISRFYTPSGRLIQTPYKRGEREEYYQEKVYQNGESSARNLSKVPDSLKYTTDSGRVVTGGGGILPDYVVSPDTLTPLLKAFGRKNVIGHFARMWLDGHGKDLRKRWEEQDTFTDEFEVSDRLFGSLLDFAEQRGLLLGPSTGGTGEAAGSFSRSEVEDSRPVIEVLLEAHLARRLFGRQAWYPFYNRLDPAFQQAMKHWEQAREMVH